MEGLAPVTWIVVDCDLPDHPKMAALPSDTARYGWIAVLAKAKRQRKPGLFASEAHFKAVAGRFGKFLTNYLTVGLLDKTDDGLAVHDWQRHQWAAKKAGQREDNPGTSEGQEGDIQETGGGLSRAGSALSPLPVDVSVKTPGVRSGEGVAHLVALQDVTLLPVERIEAKTRREFDRLADQRGSENVAVAIREVAERIPTQPPAARQLMVEVLRVLEPFTQPSNGNHAKGIQPSRSEVANAFRS